MSIVGAVAGTLIGALVGGLFTYLATSRQVSGETERSRAEFLRAQRQTAYAALIADTIDLQKVAGAYAFSINYNLSDRKQQYNSLFSKLQKFTVDLAPIEIIGSNGAVGAALQLNKEIIDYQGRLVERDHPIGKTLVAPPAGGGTPQQKAQLDKDNAEGRTIVSLRDDFIGAARNDLAGS